MRTPLGYEEHATCGICVEPLDAQSRSQQDPGVHAKCWNVTHEQPRGWRRSFLDTRGALTHGAESETTHG